LIDRQEIQRLTDALSEKKELFNQLQRDYYNLVDNHKKSEIKFKNILDE